MTLWQRFVAWLRMSLLLDPTPPLPVLEMQDEELQERERRQYVQTRDRAHRDDLQAFDAALCLPPEAFLTRREWYTQQRGAPMIHGARYIGAGTYVVLDHDGSEVRFFDDRVGPLPAGG